MWSALSCSRHLSPSPRSFWSCCISPASCSDERSSPVGSEWCTTVVAKNTGIVSLRKLKPLRTGNWIPVSYLRTEETRYSHGRGETDSHRHRSDPQRYVVPGTKVQGHECQPYHARGVHCKTWAKDDGIFKITTICEMYFLWRITEERNKKSNMHTFRGRRKIGKMEWLDKKWVNGRLESSARECGDNEGR